LHSPEPRPLRPSPPATAVRRLSTQTPSTGEP
jgi:hypothetical protein